jgi:hypothetical protein
VTVNTDECFEEIYTFIFKLRNTTLNLRTDHG